MKEFERLIEIMERLRRPGGCPWDAEQDHQSISHCVIEEAYELVDAIATHNTDHLREELGDLLLQVVFHSIIASDQGEFTMQDVISELCEKLMHRHPHVFGDATVRDSGEVIRNWEQLKRKEKGKRKRESIFDGIPEALPALLSARKLQSSAKRAGHDLGGHERMLNKLSNEISDLTAAIESGHKEQIEHTLGEALFSLVNLARCLGIDPEASLRKVNKRFRDRFNK